MAREKCRYVSTSFWDDEWIQSLDPSEKLLYLYLLTNPLTTIAGIYKITVRRMCFDTGFNTDTIGHILGKLEKAGKVFMFNGWLILPNWPKHQKVGKDDNNRKGIDTILKSLPDDVFQFIVQHGYTYQYINDLGRTVQAPCKPLARPSNYINLNLNLNPNLNSNIKDIAPPPATPAKIDPLYHKIKDSFEAIHGVFTNYPREGKAIKQIIKYTKGDEQIIKLMLETFLTLTKSTDKFWSTQPYTPSTLAASGIWDRVKIEAEKQKKANEPWWERFEAEEETRRVQE
jgi:hypothetical protein